MSQEISDNRMNTWDELDPSVGDSPELTSPEVEIKTAEMIKQELKDLKYKSYCINFKSRLEQWSNSHDGRTDYPIRYDSEYGDFVWLNRKIRRG